MSPEVTFIRKGIPLLCVASFQKEQDRTKQCGLTKLISEVMLYNEVSLKKKKTGYCREPFLF